MSKWKRLVLAAALLASVSSAKAQTETYATSGAWSAYAGRNVEGNPMCGMKVNGKDRGAYIKWQINDNGVFIHISKSGWDIPPGTKMPFALSFDRTGRSEGIARTVPGNRQMIEAIILNDGDGLTFEQFMNYFMKAEKMFFSFPGGSENDWWITLDGSETIGRRFMQCIVEYSDRYGNKKPTQPYGSGATQPHGSNNGGTQPHSGGGNWREDRTANVWTADRSGRAADE